MDNALFLLGFVFLFIWAFPRQKAYWGRQSSVLQEPIDDGKLIEIWLFGRWWTILRMKALCKTCGEPYTKASKMTSRAMFCSSSFHCCKDCKWSWDELGCMSRGKLIEWCEDCKKVFPDGYIEWLKNNTGA